MRLLGLLGLFELFELKALFNPAPLFHTCVGTENREQRKEKRGPALFLSFFEGGDLT